MSKKTPKDRSQQLREERGKIYGDPRLSHENIGLAWTGLIQQYYGIRLPKPIPPHLTALMMADLKNSRAVREFHLDNYDDGHVYLDFGKEFQEEDSKR